jgi:hypothetical protein
MGGSWWGTTAPDPDAPLGLTNAEIFALPQLRFQLAGVVAAHVVAYTIFKRWTKGPFARKPYLMARYVPFVGVFAFQSAYGLYLWLYDADLAAMDRVWGAHGGARAITTSMLAVQLFDVPISCGAPELSHATFLAHHAVVACLAYFGLRYRAFNYYAPYFLGAIELSSPFLAVVEAMRDFPKLAETFPVTNEVSRVAFAVLFYAVRVVFWVAPSRAFWSDALGLLAAGGPMHATPKAVVYFWLFTHAGLTCLQVWWAFLIAKAAVALVTGDTAARANEAKSA